MGVLVELNATQTKKLTKKLQNMLINRPWIVRQYGPTYVVERNPDLLLRYVSPGKGIQPAPETFYHFNDLKTAKFCCADKNAEAIVAELMK